MRLESAPLSAAQHIYGMGQLKYRNVSARKVQSYKAPGNRPK